MSEIKFITKNDKKNYTLGIVYEPNVVDTQNDFATEEEIEKACWDYMKMLQGKDAFTKTAVDVLYNVIKAFETQESVRVDVTDIWGDVSKRGLNDMHVNTEDDENLGTVVECMIAPSDMIVGDQIVKKGTWLLGVEWNPEYFAKIESGERTGYSMEGKAIRVEVKEKDA
jgi:hypothetical protein